MANNYDDDGQKKPHAEVIISDMRHRRNVDDEPEEPAEPPQVAEEPAVQPAEPVAVATPPEEQQAAPVEAEDAEPVVSETPWEPAEPSDSLEQYGEAGDLPPGITEEEVIAAQREQLRYIISMGVMDYLRSQLTMLLNFALLNLGSAADPTTGLVAKNLPQAKLAIDVLEFLVGRLQAEMQPAERQQMQALVTDLKYAFMQAASSTIPPPPAGEGKA